MARGVALDRLLEELDAAQAGQHLVRDDQRDVFALEDREPLLAAGGREDAVVGAERQLERFEDRGLVVDDQDAVGRPSGDRRAPSIALPDWSSLSLTTASSVGVAIARSRGRQDISPGRDRRAGAAMRAGPAFTGLAASAARRRAGAPWPGASARAAPPRAWPCAWPCGAWEPAARRCACGPRSAPSSPWRRCPACR